MAWQVPGTPCYRSHARGTAAPILHDFPTKTSPAAAVRSPASVRRKPAAGPGTPAGTAPCAWPCAGALVALPCPLLPCAWRPAARWRLPPGHPLRPPGRRRRRVAARASTTPLPAITRGLPAPPSPAPPTPHGGSPPQTWWAPAGLRPGARPLARRPLAVPRRKPHR